MKTINRVIEGQLYKVNDVLKDFDIVQPDSTFVTFFGVDKKHNRTFFQFTNGTAFIYEATPPEIMAHLINAESVGKFFHGEIKGKFENTQIDNHSIEKSDEISGVDDYDDTDDDGDSQPLEDFWDDY